MAQKSFSKPKPKPVKPDRKAKNNLYKKVATGVKKMKEKLASCSYA